MKNLVNQLSCVISLVVISMCIIQLCSNRLSSLGKGKLDSVLACGLKSTIKEAMLAVNSIIANAISATVQLTPNIILGKTII